MSETFCLTERVRTLKKNAATRWNIEEQDCHVGHLLLQSMLQEPDVINQVDGATGQKETNFSVAKRSAELASAMAKYGLKTGDTVVIIGHSHLDLVIPFYACHFGGYSMCAIDPLAGGDLKKLWTYIHPKMIFCQKSYEEKINEVFRENHESCEVIIFDDEKINIEAFIKKHDGTENNYRPAILDQSKTAAWLILTSGTTGLPKVSIITFSCVLNAIICWWLPIQEKIKTVLAMSSLQWMSGLLFFVSGPILSYMRLQSSVPASAENLIKFINQYKPCGTAWTPFLLGRFLEIAEKVCDLSCFKHITIGGSSIEKPLFDKLRTVCQAKINVVYGMTELLVPVFEYNEETPFGAAGKPYVDKYEYRLVDADDNVLDKPNQIGELWIKGDAFFKGYLNNLEETKLILTEDGWFKTGDMFYKDNQNYYYFVERKKLLIRHYGFQISPLQMEEVLKRHDAVSDACVVSVPEHECMEIPVAAVQRRNGNKVDPKDLFDLLDNNIIEGRKLNVGIFFVDSLPITASGKVHRARVKEIAMNIEWSIFSRNI